MVRSVSTWSRNEKTNSTFVVDFHMASTWHCYHAPPLLRLLLPLLMLAAPTFSSGRGRGASPEVLGAVRCDLCKALIHEVRRDAFIERAFICALSVCIHQATTARRRHMAFTCY